MKPPITRARAAVRAMRPTARALPPMPAVNPPAAPRALAPSGNRPMGVAPPPLHNPIPMSPMEAQSRARTSAQRGVKPLPQQAMTPQYATQPGFRTELPAVAMAEGGRAGKHKGKSKAKRK